jgi:hypothetical protein
MTPEEIEELVCEYADSMADYELKVRRGKVVRSDKKRLQLLTEAQLAYNNAQVIKRELSKHGVMVKRSMT